MEHVNHIVEKFERGSLEEAEKALETLLLMGPRNIEALKIKAYLLEVKGRFDQEAAVWQSLSRIDQEDADLQSYYARRQMEDREHFYFTDPLPEGGRRYVAYPRPMIRASLGGLMGCMIFLTMSRLTYTFPIINQPAVLLALFCLTVIAPWGWVLWSFFRVLKYLEVSPKGLLISSRRFYGMKAWDEIKELTLSQQYHRGQYQLTLMVVPKDDSTPILEFALDQSKTSIRARSHFLEDVARYSRMVLENKPRAQVLHQPTRKVFSF